MLTYLEKGLTYRSLPTPDDLNSTELRPKKSSVVGSSPIRFNGLIREGKERGKKTAEQNKIKGNRSQGCFQCIVIFFFFDGLSTLFLAKTDTII